MGLIRSLYTATRLLMRKPLLVPGNRRRYRAHAQQAQTSANLERRGAFIEPPSSAKIARRRASGACRYACVCRQDCYPFQQRCSGTCSLPQSVASPDGRQSGGFSRLGRPVATRPEPVLVQAGQDCENRVPRRMAGLFIWNGLSLEDHFYGRIVSESQEKHGFLHLFVSGMFEPCPVLRVHPIASQEPGVARLLLSARGRKDLRPLV